MKCGRRILPVSNHAATRRMRLSPFLLLVLVATLLLAPQRDALETGFANPPKEARLRCYWWWLNGNTNQATITRDLEEMKAKGYGGALLVDAGGADQQGNLPVPAGPMFGSPEWRALYRHALREAARLGIEISLNIQSGWNLGGPTVKPEHAAKLLTWSRLTVDGPADVHENLAPPSQRNGFFRDIAVLAYPLRHGRAPGRPIRQLAVKSASQEFGMSMPATIPLLDDLPAQPGEEDALASRRQLMMHAEKIAAELAEALDVLQGEGTDGARLAAALRRIERQAQLASALLAPIAEALERVIAETNAARAKVEEALAETAFEPRELEGVEERLFGLRAAARKHKVLVDDLPALKDRLEAELAALDVSEGRAAELEQAAASARKSYESAALSLSKARKAAAARLDEEVTRELAPLKLEKASFITHMESVPLAEGGPSGIDRIAFFVRTNPGTEPGPLMKVASGGELARVILALKVVLAARGSAPTLIFDEADAGVGGATAAAVGERLATLAARVQVLAVTHAPQVAALASGHMLIAKEAVHGPEGEAMATRVSVLEGAHRREEIARMLAGQTITDEARAAATRLMNRSA